jgi:cell wall-associated NlpC family hydrolase
VVQVAFGAEGINLPRDSNQQFYLGSLVATRWYRNGLRRGDTLYFLGSHGKIRHTAIYLGDDKYIEAVRPAVQITSFNPEDENYDARRAAAFAFAKRLLE